MMTGLAIVLATVTLDGVTFTIRGGYPVNGNVTVTDSGTPKKVVFRKPSWCRNLDYGVAWQDDVNKYIRDAYRETSALTVWNGPLLLAKSRKLGMKGSALWF